MARVFRLFVISRSVVIRHIPEEGETIEMKLCGWLFSVELFEEKRILKVLATKLPEEEKEEADETTEKKKGRFGKKKK